MDFGGVTLRGCFHVCMWFCRVGGVLSGIYQSFHFWLVRNESRLSRKNV